MKSPATRKALAWVHLVLLSAVTAGHGSPVGDPVPEVNAIAVPEPSPMLLLAGALAVFFLLKRKGGPR